MLNYLNENEKVIEYIDYSSFGTNYEKHIIGYSGNYLKYSESFKMKTAENNTCEYVKSNYLLNEPLYSEWVNYKFGTGGGYERNQTYYILGKISKSISENVTESNSAHSEKSISNYINGELIEVIIMNITHPDGDTIEKTVTGYTNDVIDDESQGYNYYLKSENTTFKRFTITDDGKYEYYKADGKVFKKRKME